jgi:hypothetical protein
VALHCHPRCAHAEPIMQFGAWGEKACHYTIFKTATC